MKIRRITATPINFPLEAPYGWVFGELFDDPTPHDPLRIDSTTRWG